MRVEKRSVITGRSNIMELDITMEQIDRWKGGELIQKVFPNLNSSEREFLMTGITPEEWSKYMGGFE